MSSIIVDCGITGSGKTFRSLKLGENIKHKHNKYVVDPEREYVLETDYEQIYPETDIKSILNFLRDSYTIIDCANYFFPLATQNKPLERALGGCRHRNNIIFLSFHSLQQVPVYIRNYINTMIIGHTNDPEYVLKRYGYRDEELRAAYHRIKQNIKKPHYCEVI